MDPKSGSLSLPQGPTQSNDQLQQALLALALSRKRSNAAVAKDSSAGKGKATVKRQKINTVPKAASTLKADVLAKFQKLKKKSKQSVDVVVPKTKIATKLPVTATTSSQLLAPQSTLVEGTNLESDDLTESYIQSQMDILRKKIVSGEVDMSQLSFLGAEETVISTKKTPTTAEESDNVESPPYLESQDMFSSQRQSPSPSLVSNGSDDETQDLDLDKMNDQLNNQRDDPSHEDESQSVNSEQAQYQVLASYEEKSNKQECLAQEPQLADGNISIAGISMNLVDLQNEIHSEQCCSVCRLTLSMIVEKLNLIIQQLAVLLAQGIQVPSRAPFKPEDYPLMPEFPLKTQLDLVVFNTLLETKEEAVAQFKSLISRVSGKCPPNEIRRILARVIDDELADLCTWQIPKQSKDGKQKLVVEDYKVFECIADIVINNWKGAKDKNGVDVVVTIASATSVMQDWIRRSSTRLQIAAEKAALLAEKSKSPAESNNSV